MLVIKEPYLFPDKIDRRFIKPAWTVNVLSLATVLFASFLEVVGKVGWRRRTCKLLANLTIGGSPVALCFVS